MIFDPNQSNRLVGAHAELYSDSVGMMLDVYRECMADDDPESYWSFGVALFDGLQWQQQLALLAQVSKCVLEGTGAPEQWNALEKASYLAVYRNVYQQLEIEQDLSEMDPALNEFLFKDDDFDFDDSDNDSDDLSDSEESVEGDEDEHSWTELISAAYVEKGVREGLAAESLQAVPGIDADDEEALVHWNELLDGLADQFLDDRDFEMAPTLMDADPEVASEIKKALGIAPDYFIETADEPSDAEVANLFRELAALVGVADLRD